MVKTNRRAARVAITTVLCSLALVSALLPGSGVRAAGPFEGPVPRANCANNNPAFLETALQGEVPLADRNSGRSQLGYRCNLELVGQYQGVGAGWQNAWYGHCDYYDTAQNTTAPGVQVLDLSDPAHPTPTTTLTTPAMLAPWESLKVNQKRGLLAAVAAEDPAGQGPLFFDVYDIKADCAHPTELASVPMNIPSGHEGNWAPDGMTYYGSSTYASTIAAIDVTNPASPTLVTVAHNATHGLSTSDDGKTLYMANTGGNGLDILDASSIQDRSTAPVTTLPTTGHVYWTDGSTAQHTIPITYSGHPYVVFVDEGGGSSSGSGTSGVPAGAARIIDIGDPANPSIVSVLRDEIQMSANGVVNQADISGDGLFGYEAHYCAVDQENDPTALACGYFQSGIRVFDIRDPRAPREIAYYNPPAQVAKHGQLPGSEHAGGSLGAAQPPNLTADWCTSQIHFSHATDGSYQLWAQCQDNGFMALRFTNGVYPLTTAALVPEAPWSVATLPALGFGTALTLWMRRRRRAEGA